MKQNHDHDADRKDINLTIRDLIARATLAHETGDLQSYHHIVGSIANHITDDSRNKPKAVSGRVKEVLDELKAGYLDVAGLCASTKLNPNRIHIALTVLRQKGYKIKSKNFKRYHIEP